DLRSHYVLMFRSRSLHGSSFAHPRAILFDPEARFVVSFNGDAGQAGFTALETMEFDDSDKSFKFREITFPSFAPYFAPRAEALGASKGKPGAGAQGAAKGEPSEARSANGGVNISHPNPPRCLRCHGEPARPVWDTHPEWPGAYGERYDAGV